MSEAATRKQRRSSSAGPCRAARMTGWCAGRRSSCRAAVGDADRDPGARAARQAGRRQLHPRQEEGRERAGADAGRSRRATSARTTRAKSSRSTANRAVQRSSDVPVVDIEGMLAQLDLSAGPADDRGATRAATISTRRRSRSTGRCGSPGPTAIGWRRATSRSTSKQRRVPARARSRAQMRLGQFQAGQLRPTSASGPSSSTAALA